MISEPFNANLISRKMLLHHCFLRLAKNEILFPSFRICELFVPSGTSYRHLRVCHNVCGSRYIKEVCKFQPRSLTQNHEARNLDSINDVRTIYPDRSRLVAEHTPGRP